MNKKGNLQFNFLLTGIIFLFIVGLVTLVFVVAGSNLQNAVTETGTNTIQEVIVGVQDTGTTLTTCSNARSGTGATILEAQLADYPTSGLLSFSENFALFNFSNYYNVTANATIVVNNNLNVFANSSANYTQSILYVNHTGNRIFFDDFTTSVEFVVNNVSNLPPTNRTELFLSIEEVGVGHEANETICGVMYNASGSYYFGFVESTLQVNRSQTASLVESGTISLSFNNETNEVICDFGTVELGLTHVGKNNENYTIALGALLDSDATINKATGKYNISFDNLLYTQRKLIGSGNYTTSGCTVFADSASDYNFLDWNITYNYLYTSNGEAVEVMNETKLSLASTTDWFDIFIVMMVLTVLIAVVVLIVLSIRNSGLVGGDA